MTKCNGTKFLPNNSILLKFWTIFFTENIGYPFNIFPVIGTWGTKYLKYQKRILLRRMHHFLSDLINNMDYMHISGTKPSSVILSKTK